MVEYSTRVSCTWQVRYTKYMNIDFYFDPSCPFCWITSRWLLVVSNERDINVTWKPFSLALKNDELTADSTPHGKGHRNAHRLLRVMMAANKEHNASLIDMYTTSGISHHVAGMEIDDDLIMNVLDEYGLPETLLSQANDDAHDAALQQYITDATDIAGQDIGVPTIIFTATDGTKQGFFGPVLQELPEKAEALELWDGLSKMATNTSFYELKRSRPSGGPDVFSTAKC